MRSLRLAGLVAAGVASAGAAAVVDDVTRLNPIAVRGIVAPRSVGEVVEAVRAHEGPVSIAGGRFSQGGQTATDGALQIDMRRLDRIVAFSKPRKEITVQAGMTWRQIQEFIDRHDLSVQIMQTYANFTVGGALSVNAHGRYVGRGPLVRSVRSIRIVLADGALVDASPGNEPEIFYGAIGGYGAMGVIVEATLALDDNVRVERRSEVMPLSAYGAWFDREVRGDPAAIFHNADLYPPAFDTVRATTYARTGKPVTIEERLIPAGRSYWLNRMMFRVLSEWPWGKQIRRRVVDPLVFGGETVEWRNYEASYDVRELEPVSRRTSTYVLQEYFVPTGGLDTFARSMAGVLGRHRVNAINVSIRHATRDPGTLLAWARTDVFAFVLYYKQGTGARDRERVGVWTRELIDAAVSLGGAYYLPYQVHASEAQFRAAYPRAGEFFALKARLDPAAKFRNRLLDAYAAPRAEATTDSLTRESPDLPGAPPGEVGRPDAAGSLVRWLPGAANTQEDEFAAAVARQYQEFRRAGPWYAFSFMAPLKRLWAETDLFGPHLARKWALKVILSAGYVVRAQGATLVEAAHRVALGFSGFRPGPAGRGSENSVATPEPIPVSSAAG